MARFCAVFHRNLGNRNTGRLQYRDCTVYGRILIRHGRKPRPWITVKYSDVNGPYITIYGRIDAVLFDQGVNDRTMAHVNLDHNYLQVFLG